MAASLMSRPAYETMFNLCCDQIVSLYQSNTPVNYTSVHTVCHYITTNVYNNHTSVGVLDFQNLAPVRIAWWIDGFTSTVITILTVILNSVSILIFTSSALRSPTNTILAAISGLDMLTCLLRAPLLSYVYIWEGYKTLPPKAWCQEYNYLHNFIPSALHSTAFLLNMGLSVQRSVGVRGIRRLRSVCSYKGTVVIAVASFLLAACVHSLYPIIYHVTPVVALGKQMLESGKLQEVESCRVTARYHDKFHTLSTSYAWARISLLQLLPGIVMCACNISLIIVSYQTYNYRRQLIGAIGTIMSVKTGPGTGGDLPPSSSNNGRSSSSAGRKESHVSIVGTESPLYHGGVSIYTTTTAASSGNPGSQLSTTAKHSQQTQSPDSSPKNQRQHKSNSAHTNVDLLQRKDAHDFVSLVTSFELDTNNACSVCCTISDDVRENRYALKRSISEPKGANSVVFGESCDATCHRGEKRDTNSSLRGSLKSKTDFLSGSENKITSSSNEEKSLNPNRNVSGAFVRFPTKEKRLWEGDKIEILCGGTDLFSEEEERNKSIERLQDKMEIAIKIQTDTGFMSAGNSKDIVQDDFDSHCREVEDDESRSESAEISKTGTNIHHHMNEIGSIKYHRDKDPYTTQPDSPHDDRLQDKDLIGNRCALELDENSNTHNPKHDIPNSIAILQQDSNDCSHSQQQVSPATRGDEILLTPLVNTRHSDPETPTTAASSTTNDDVIVSETVTENTTATSVEPETSSFSLRRRAQDTSLAELRPTIMLVLVTSCTLFAELMVTVALFINFMNQVVQADFVDQDSLITFILISNLVTLVSFPLNFVFFCGLSRPFRNTLLENLGVIHGKLCRRQKL